MEDKLWTLITGALWMGLAMFYGYNLGRQSKSKIIVSLFKVIAKKDKIIKRYENMYGGKHGK